MHLKQFCNLKCLKIIKKIDFCSLSKMDFNTRQYCDSVDKKGPIVRLVLS